MNPQPPFIWEQQEPGWWFLVLPRGVNGDAYVMRNTEKVGSKWIWHIGGFDERANAKGIEPTREEAMVAAQRAILTKSGRRAPTRV